MQILAVIGGIVVMFLAIFIPRTILGVAVIYGAGMYTTGGWHWLWLTIPLTIVGFAIDISFLADD